MILLLPMLQCQNLIELRIRNRENNFYHQSRETGHPEHMRHHRALGLSWLQDLTVSYHTLLFRKHRH